jgi:hypothetical protein
MVRIPSVCNHNPETTVLAHFRLAGYCGMGMKPDDALGAWACSACHDAIDGRTKTGYDRTTLELWHAHGVMRTFAELRKEGLL